MNKVDPKSWKMPNWHSDWVDAEREFEALKAFSLATLEACPGIAVELDAFEEGYLKVDISNVEQKVAEVYASPDTLGVEYVLYLEQQALETEHRFRALNEGIEILRRNL